MNAPNRMIRTHEALEALEALEVTIPRRKRRLVADRRTSHINWERWIILALLCGTWANAILLLVAER